MSGPSLETLAVEEPLSPAGWRPLLRAAGFTGSGSVLSAALSVTATKIFAAMLGPAEVAVLATLQQIRQAGLTGATLNGGTALVQGATARQGRERREFLRTALLLMGSATALAAVFLLAAPGWIAASTGLGAERSGLIRWLAVPLAFSSALVFLGALLNARGAIGRLALVQVASPAALALLAYPVARTIRTGHEGALVWWMAAAAFTAAALALVLLSRLTAGAGFGAAADGGARKRRADS